MTTEGIEAVFVENHNRGKSGTRLMTVRDPDGREWELQAPGGSNDE
ncbi:MAG: hypothetical protein NVS4B6_01060 [Mycobacterium sp.]